MMKCDGGGTWVVKNKKKHPDCREGKGKDSKLSVSKESYDCQQFPQAHSDEQGGKFNETFLLTQQS